MHFVSVDGRNVGAARAVGFRYARSLCGDDGECWYATTDADSQVDPDWLVHQLLGADMMLGVVRVDDWHHHSADVADRYTRDYGETATRTADTSTFTEQTWVSLPRLLAGRWLSGAVLR